MDVLLRLRLLGRFESSSTPINCKAEDVPKKARFYDLMRDLYHER